MQNNILLVDFGSTYTKLTLVDLDKEEIVATATSYSTVDTNIKLGYQRALETIKTKVNEQLNIKEIIACSWEPRVEMTNVDHSLRTNNSIFTVRCFNLCFIFKPITSLPRIAD